VSTQRSTHPCPACGHGVALTARFCGACGAPQADQRDRAAELRAELTGLAARFRAADLLPTALVDALDGLGAAPVRRSPRVVLVGELGRGSRALANRLAGSAVLSAGPSQRGAPAFLDQSSDDLPEGSVLAAAAIEVAPPLAAGADTTSEGVIPAVMRADVLVFALSAAQLLSATERRLLTALAGLTDAPIALAVGRMDAIETDEDLDDIVRRTERFRSTLSPVPEVFLLPADTDDAPRLQEWIHTRIADVGKDTDLAWESRVRHLLTSVAAVLAASKQPVEALPGLETLQDQLLAAHSAARSAARTRLEEGLGKLRDMLGDHLADMSPEQRVHEGASELAIAIEALLRESVDTWKSHLADGLANAELPAASLQAAIDRPDTVGDVTGDTPKLAPRLPDQSYGLMAAAVGLSVGVLMLPAGGSGAIAIGLGLTAGSVAVAKVLKGRRDDELRQAHTEALDGWLREVGVRSEDWLVDHVDGAHELIDRRLSELHRHAVQHRNQSTPAALRRDLSALSARLSSAGAA
jgi:hypothetical protein